MIIPNAKKTTLKNGLTILTEEIPSLRSVSMGILVGAGAGNETPDESGLSHFIEHMVFKGTKKRSAYEIAQALDSVGGKMNAYTGKEYTMYYAVVLDKHIDTAIDVLSDVLLNSLYDEKEMALEKGVVLEEIKMYEDTPDESIHDFFAEKILHGHSLAKPILGTKASVPALSRARIQAYLKRWYVPQNIVVALAGALPKDSLKRLAPALEPWQGTHQPHVPDPLDFKGSISLKKKKTEQAHLCLGVKGVSQVDEDRYPYAILDNILGGSMSSRLFQEIREKRGLAYSIFSTSSPYHKFGIAYVYAGISPKNLEQVVGLILKEFTKLKKDGVSPKELNRAREYMKGSLVLGLESTSARMSWLAKCQLYYGRTMTIDEIFAKVDKVTHDDIVRMANKFFRDEYLTLAVISDMDKLPIKELSC